MLVQAPRDVKNRRDQREGVHSAWARWARGMCASCVENRPRPVRRACEATPFKASADGLDPYVPDEDDGTVPALHGKWYEAERFARWLRRHSEKGGRMILHSIEADGEAWGWEFDGRGRMRRLSLARVGKWE